MTCTWAAFQKLKVMEFVCILSDRYLRIEAVNYGRSDYGIAFFARIKQKLDSYGCFFLDISSDH